LWLCTLEGYFSINYSPDRTGEVERLRHAEHDAAVQQVACEVVRAVQRHAEAAFHAESESLRHFAHAGSLF
jgi:hypothetical protein